MKSGTAFASGQLAELQAMFSPAAAVALPKAAATFGDPKAVLRALKDKSEVLASHLEAAIAQAIGRMMVLTPRGSVSVVLAEPHDPDPYYRTRSGLWVLGDYRNRIVSKAKPLATGTTFAVDISEIGAENGATDKEIEGALPKQHLFDESAICAIVASMITKQMGGTVGDLENTGKVNLFYTLSCVVRVVWGAGSAEWNVYTWYRDGRRWRAGRRVFSPGN